MILETIGGLGMTLTEALDCLERDDSESKGKPRDITK